MKKLFLVLIMFIGVASFAKTIDPIKALPIDPTLTKVKVANVAKVAKVAKVESVESVEKMTVVGSAEDAIYCSFTAQNGASASCWFCDCNELAKTLRDNPKKQ